MEEYEKQRSIIGAHLKNDNVKEVIRNTEIKTMLTVVLKVGKTLPYFGEMATDIYKFIFKKRYSIEENPERTLRRCPSCNKRDSIFEHDSDVFCNKCDYKTDVQTWNKENKHLEITVTAVTVNPSIKCD